MADEQVNITSLVAILVISGLIIRYFFFSPPPPPASSQSGRWGGSSSRHSSSRQSQSADAVLRQREAAVEHLQQMFPEQVDRRALLWDLQRNGGNIEATANRIIVGRLETPPITFQPPPPPAPPAGAASAAAQAQASSSSAAGGASSKPAEKPAQPDLIQRYNLQDKVAAAAAEESESSSGVSISSGGSASGRAGRGAWSANKDERHSLLQKRRDEMILAARRRMEAKLAAEKGSGS